MSEERILTSADVGSDAPMDQVTSTKLSSPGQYPEEHEDSPLPWKAAYDHAAKHGNTVKGAKQYADAHSHDFEELDPSEDPKVLKAQIAQLEALLEDKLEMERQAAKETPAEETPKAPRGKSKK